MPETSSKRLTRRQKDIVQDFMRTVTKTDYIGDFVDFSDLDEAFEACKACVEIGIQ